VLIENALFLSDHPMLTTGTTLRKVKPPCVSAMIDNGVDRCEHALVETVATHWHCGQVG
jgi:hypothetical protein